MGDGKSITAERAVIRACAIRYEMLDTVIGTPMGVTPASATGTGATLLSSRYVLKQTWTEGASVVSTSPSYTFAAQANRRFVANFVPVGTAKTLSTSSSPANAGSTTGDSAYALAASATVVATANPGYKFSKWQEGGVTVNGAGSPYTFQVAGDRFLVARFKPVYTVTVTNEPAGDFEVQAGSRPPANLHPP